MPEPINNDTLGWSKKCRESGGIICFLIKRFIGELLGQVGIFFVVKFYYLLLFNPNVNNLLMRFIAFEDDFNLKSLM